MRRFVHKIVVLAGFCVLLGIIPANAANRLLDADCVRAIIGEASNQGYLGMLAVAEAIRNRGHLRGVYGLRAKHVDREPPWVWAMAHKAWTNSRTTNTVKGADHWHNVNREGENYWTKKMTETVTIGDHTFFK